MLYRLGRQPRAHDPRVLNLWSFLSGRRRLSLAPPTIDYTKGMPPNLGEMLNDQLGCCTCAAFYHARQVWKFNTTGVTDTQPDSNVLALYEGACGYKPSDPKTDQGGVEQDVLKYLLNTGAPIGDGSQRDKLAAFVEVDPKNSNDVKNAIYMCGVAYIGFDVPAYLMAAGGPPDVWDVSASGDSSTIGGHAIVLAGYLPTGNYVGISWGRTYEITPQFFARQVDEVYGLADTDWLKQTGLTPWGVPLADLEAQMQALKAAA